MDARVYLYTARLRAARRCTTRPWPTSPISRRSSRRFRDHPAFRGQVELCGSGCRDRLQQPRARCPSMARAQPATRGQPTRSRFRINRRRRPITRRDRGCTRCSSRPQASCEEPTRTANPAALPAGFTFRWRCGDRHERAGTLNARVARALTAPAHPYRSPHRPAPNASGGLSRELGAARGPHIWPPPTSLRPRFAQREVSAQPFRPIAGLCR